MLQQTKNITFVWKMLLPYAKSELTKDMVKDWIETEGNLVLKEEDNVSLWTFEKKGLYSGHYYFTVRGKQAKELAKKMISEMFYSYSAEALMGLTPVEKKHARWMSRQLGFKSQGIIETPEGLCELFVLNKKDFK